MDFIEDLKQEHEIIERELLELETVSSFKEINLNNLVHVLSQLFPLWDSHEEKEEKFFLVLKSQKFVIPVKKMLFEHKELRVYKDSIKNAINSGNNSSIRYVMEKQMPVMIKKLRSHIREEDEILYRIPITEEENKKIRK